MAINTPNTKLQDNPEPPTCNNYGISDYTFGKSPSTRGAPGWERGNAMGDGGSGGLKMTVGGGQGRHEHNKSISADEPD